MSLQDKSLEIDPESQDTEFRVEKVLSQQDIKSQSHYLIKWKRYSSEENT